MGKKRLSQDDVIHILQGRCVAAGSQSHFAEANGFSASYLSDVLLKRRDPSEKILDALGLERIVEYQPK